MRLFAFRRPSCRSGSPFDGQGLGRGAGRPASDLPDRAVEAPRARTLADVVGVDDRAVIRARSSTWPASGSPPDSSSRAADAAVDHP